VSDERRDDGRERDDGRRDDEHQRAIDPEQLLRVRVGHGANCSSIGSVVDTLFATAAVGAAVFAAVAAALKNEPVRVAGRGDPGAPVQAPRGDRPGDRSGGEGG
jgi:hypothetical protein